jgi:threonine aldolase
MIDRREFIQKGSGLVASLAFSGLTRQKLAKPTLTHDSKINFWSDGVVIEPIEYAKQLLELTSTSELAADAYGKGKIIKDLEELFKAETGKESCVFLPTGTLANQLALRVLCGTKNKVLVPETSHIYRDEADAAQVIHNKRLVPLAKDKACFSANELEDYLATLTEQEVFPGSIGALCIENTNRRCYEEIVDLAEMKKIFQFAKNSNIRVHLDGARLYIASAYSGVSVKEYAAQADTVYISMYKYFGAGTGAVLCGDKEIIDSIRALSKPMGASTYQNWMHACIALAHHKQFLQHYPSVVRSGQSFANRINSTSEFLRVEQFTNGSNTLKLLPKTFFKKTEFRDYLKNKENIQILPFEEDFGFFPLKINASLLSRSTESVVKSFEMAVGEAQ